MSYIVVDDLRDDAHSALRCGSVVSDAVVPKLKDIGVCLLPYESDGSLEGATHGFFKRDYGSSGILLSAAPSAVARAVLFTSPSKKRIFWAARIAPVSSVLKKIKGSDQFFSGSVRLANDPTSSGLSGALSATHNTTYGFRALQDTDGKGGWNIAGEATVNANEGIHGFMLYGNGPGLSLLWMAVTLTA